MLCYDLIWILKSLLSQKDPQSFRVIYLDIFVMSAESDTSSTNMKPIQYIGHLDVKGL